MPDVKAELYATRRKYELLLSSKEMVESERRLIGEMLRNIDVQLGELEGGKEDGEKEEGEKERSEEN